MKVKELVGVLNCSSTLPVRLKTCISDPGCILTWKNQQVIFRGDCTVLSFTVTQDEMTIFYKPVKV